jgi:IS5 family transposase
MRPKERRDSGQKDLFRARLDQIIDMGHPLAKLARTVDWRFLEERFGAAYTDKPGHPPLPTRLMAGLSILKHMHDLSDEVLCERWIENPYYQLFCGEEFFRHALVFDRSSLTRWRQRMGEEKLVALIQESLNVATRTGAAKPADFSKVIVDTTVQPKAVAFPTDAKLMHRERERLVRLAKKHGLMLRRSYERVGKYALIKHQRYAHAKQFKRANRALRTLRTYLGRVTRDIMRKIKGQAELESVFALPLSLSRRVREQRKNQRGKKVYSLHAPEVECIGKGKAHRPYEFGVKVSIATTLHHSKGGQFIAHAKGDAGQSLRWPHVGNRHSGDRGADRRQPIAHHRRPWLPRPQCAARSSLQGLYLRPEAARHRTHQTRVAPTLRRRTGHRPRQRRTSDGSQLPRRTSRRRDQRRPRRRRIQLQEAAGLAGALVVDFPARHRPRGEVAKSARRRLSWVLHERRFKVRLWER